MLLWDKKMYYQKLIESTYFEAISLNQKIPMDLKIALKNHNRMPMFLKNLSDQITKAQDLSMSKNKKIPDIKIKEIVYSFTDMFVEMVQKEAAHRHQSDIQKKFLETEAQKKQDLENTASGIISGEYVDLFLEGGIQTNQSVKEL